MFKNIIVALLSMFGVATAAFADDWANYPVPAGAGAGFDSGNVFFAKTSLLGTEGVQTGCNNPGGGINIGISCGDGSISGFAIVPISAFARADRLDTVSDSVDAMSLQLLDIGDVIAAIQSAAIEFRQQVDGELAASASLVVLTPSAPGKTTMHLGYGYFGDQGAVGFTAAHRLDTTLPLTVDGGISLTSSSDVMARAGVGIEF